MSMTNGLRYFAVGVKDEEELFTGIIHDYTGGGEYEEALVYKNVFLPSVHEDGEPVEWDTSVEVFNKLSSISVENFEDKIFDFAHYNTEIFNQVFSFLFDSKKSTIEPQGTESHDEIKMSKIFTETLKVTLPERQPEISRGRRL